MRKTSGSTTENEHSYAIWNTAGIRLRRSVTWTQATRRQRWILRGVRRKPDGGFPPEDGGKVARRAPVALKLSRGSDVIQVSASNNIVARAGAISALYSFCLRRMAIMH
jgi:hypothetical protein